ncbi:MAG: hypothetical protein NC041_06075 [Bacteroides sp.]|nr:hypothetical protein [Prevotella sp.]MCM1407523.1 hypothetical protein [Treponema brennaborense]MCM1470013.1 hypothetical protein [Bacteroides sp.]
MADISALLRRFVQNMRQIPELLQDTGEKAADFCAEHRPLCIAGLALIVCACACLCLLPNKKQKAENTVVPDLPHQPVLPEEPGIDDGYMFSRVSPETWSKADAEKWFAVPSEKDFSELHAATRGIIYETLEAAP